MKNRSLFSRETTMAKDKGKGKKKNKKSKQEQDFAADQPLVEASEASSGPSLR
jgi:hypothetical protein